VFSNTSTSLGILRRQFSYSRLRPRCQTRSKDVKREVSIAMVPEKLLLGDWILIHTGYAISKMDPKEAKEILTLWEEIWRLEEESSHKPSSS